MENILRGFHESRYLACMIWHHFDYEFVYIIHISFPPKALFCLTKSCNPTPPDFFSIAILFNETNGIFLSSDIFPFQRKVPMIFSICRIIDFRALRTEMY